MNLKNKTPGPATTALRRFYAPPEAFAGGEVVLDAEESHHLARVLRLLPGARVVVSDGCGRQVEAEVLNLSKGTAVLRVIRELPLTGESPLQLTLAIGLAKREALDAVIRQATEMGVKLILPFTSAYSEPTTPERQARRLVRWQRLARESLKSCQRAFLPEIASVQDFPRVLPGPEDVKIIFWEQERSGGLARMVQRPRPAGVRLLIGPEGGFKPEEVAQARQAGYEIASLGPRRLKVETAALAALALLQFAWGDLA
ncbi:MAG: 16S rRNA (uracil(1498)-N(3))-methyltransferase [Deltaproteobacteria bacterium]|nr:16S rRNA (uracil(1498)-N(3))-methyltransferase [Deltaproteobacteria bacterium]